MSLRQVRVLGDQRVELVALLSLRARLLCPGDGGRAAVLGMGWAGSVPTTRLAAAQCLAASGQREDAVHLLIAAQDFPGARGSFASWQLR